MNKKNIIPYDMFTPTERINLTLAAEARGDKEEIKKLLVSCPKKTYRMPDAAYIKRLTNTEFIINLFASTYTKRALKLGFAAHIVITLEESINTYEEAFNLALDGIEATTITTDINKYIKKEKRENDILESIDKWRKIGDSHFLSLKVLHEAFRLFCAEIEINYKNSLAIVNRITGIEMDEFDQPDYIALKPDLKLIENVKEQFMELWKNPC